MSGNINFDLNNNVVSQSAKNIRTNALLMAAGTVAGATVGYYLGNQIENKAGRVLSHTMTTLSAIGGGAASAAMLKMNNEMGAFADMLFTLSETEGAKPAVALAPVRSFGAGFLGAASWGTLSRGVSLVCGLVDRKEDVVLEADSVVVIESNNEDEI